MSKTIAGSKKGRGAPAWAIAELYPEQGEWSEEEYLDLPGNRLVEFDSGFIEVLAMPTTFHQTILLFLVMKLHEFVEKRALGNVLMAALPIRLWKGKYREPDVVFMFARHAERMKEKCWHGADLVMEVVSADRHHDLVTKRREYAKARIPEYWIVDPEKREITVLRLSGAKYVVHGKHGLGETASSALLKGFQVEVSKAFSRRSTNEK